MSAMTGNGLPTMSSYYLKHFTGYTTVLRSRYSTNSSLLAALLFSIANHTQNTEFVVHKLCFNLLLKWCLTPTFGV